MFSVLHFASVFAEQVFGASDQHGWSANDGRLDDHCRCYSIQHERVRQLKQLSVQVASVMLTRCREPVAPAGQVLVVLEDGEVSRVQVRRWALRRTTLHKASLITPTVLYCGRLGHNKRRLLNTTHEG